MKTRQPNSPSILRTSSFLLRTSSSLLLTSYFVLLTSLPARAASRGGGGSSSTAATPAQAASPYTYVGRLLNNEHVAFDENFSAEIAAYDASGKKVAVGETFHRENSLRNYRIQIPLASTAAVTGTPTTGATVALEVTEPNGDTWSGVISDADAVLGAPGVVKEVDIILAEDENGDGIDDQLYTELERAWRASKYNVPGEKFDPNKDYDGDGVSTIGEVYAGTDPFDPEDALQITAFSLAPDVTDGDAEAKLLTFTVAPGRAYKVESATSLETKDWATSDFNTAPASAPINILAVPSTTRKGSPSTVYLFPKSPARFFRVKTE